MGTVLTYVDELTRGTELLLSDRRALFLGQSVFSGSALASTLKAVPDDRRIELPVFEDTQMGMSIGLALAGFIPVTIYPRFNFLLLAANQLINHLDKMPALGCWSPKVIIRVIVGAPYPLDAGPQHSGNFVDGFRAMLGHVRVEDLVSADLVYPAYERAFLLPEPTLLVEYAALYIPKREDVEPSCRR